MPMLPPLVLEPSAGEPRTTDTPRAPFTGHPVGARMARTQRRYASNYNVSYMYQPPKPMARPEPEPDPTPAPTLTPAPEPMPSPTYESTFDQWRAVADAERERLGIGAAEPHDAAMPDPAPRRRLHDALLGTTAAVLLSVLGGAVYYAWTHDGPDAAPAGTAAKGSGLSAFVQPLFAMAAKMGPQAAPAHIPASAPGGDVAAVVPPLREPPQSAALPPPPPSVAPNGPAPATLLTDKPALAVLPTSASGATTIAAEAMPTPERATAALVPLATRPEPGAAAPAPAAPAEAKPAPEQALVVTAVLPAMPSEPDTVLPATATPSRPAQAVEQMAAQAVPSVPPREPDAAPAVPAIAAATVRLAPAPEWAQAGVVPLTPPPEGAALPSTPAAASVGPVSATLAAEPAVGVPTEMARTILPGVGAQQVVSTMQLVQQMSLMVHDMHGESLRYRTEVGELTGAVQEKAANLEDRLKRAEARTASGSGAESGWRRAGIAPAAGDPGDNGELRAAAEASRALRRYHVQAGSTDAVVLSDGNAGPQQAARLLVIVGDQVPGVGRVRAIVPRGRSWLVQTDHGEIR